MVTDETVSFNVEKEKNEKSDNKKDCNCNGKCKENSCNCKNK